MNGFDRAGTRFFGFLGVLAWICAAVGVMALFTGGWDTGWPWFRGALLCALPAYSPRIMTALFDRQARRKGGAA